MLKAQNGITLVALVITIIVLIILAGVSIALVFDEDGIITKVTEGAENYQAAANAEYDIVDQVYEALNKVD